MRDHCKARGKDITLKAPDRQSLQDKDASENTAMDSLMHTPFPASAITAADNTTARQQVVGMLTPQSHEAIKELMHEGESANTRNSYQRGR